MPRVQEAPVGDCTPSVLLCTVSPGVTPRMLTPPIHPALPPPPPRDVLEGGGVCRGGGVWLGRT